MNYSSWKKYESHGRWASYYTQVDELLDLKPQTCLEIGVGNGIVGEAIVRQGIELKTLDIDTSLNPDLVGSVESIPLPDEAVDVVLCAEVLEHLPFDSFESCLKEIHRVSRDGAVISLPNWGYTIRMIIDVPGLPKIRKAWKLPVSKEHPPGGVHFWEIGKKGYSAKRVRESIEKFFEIEKEYINSWMPYHRFYRLRKKSL